MWPPFCHKLEARQHNLEYHLAELMKIKQEEEIRRESQDLRLEDQQALPNNSELVKTSQARRQFMLEIANVAEYIYTYKYRWKNSQREQKHVLAKIT